MVNFTESFLKEHNLDDYTNPDIMRQLLADLMRMADVLSKFDTSPDSELLKQWDKIRAEVKQSKSDYPRMAFESIFHEAEEVYEQYKERYGELKL